MVQRLSTSVRADLLLQEAGHAARGGARQHLLAARMRDGSLMKVSGGRSHWLGVRKRQGVASKMLHSGVGLLA